MIRIRVAPAIALLAFMSTCTDRSPTTPADAASSGGDGADAVDHGPPTDVGAPGSCLRIRACTSVCAEAACIQTCVEQGTPAAQTLFGQLESCASAACPDAQDEVCRCQAQCIFPGACTELQDACSEGVDDPSCVRCF